MYRIVMKKYLIILSVYISIVYGQNLKLDSIYYYDNNNIKNSINLKSLDIYFFNAIKLCSDSVLYINESGHLVKDSITIIIVDISDNSYKIEWVAKRLNRTIQYGYINKSKFLDGDFKHIYIQDTSYCSFKNGYKNEFEIFFYDNEKTINYYIQSKKEGPSITYVDKFVYKFVEYKYGKKNGIEKVFIFDNFLRLDYEHLYKNDKIVDGSYKKYNSDGTVYAINTYKNGLLNGWQYAVENKKKKKSMKFKNGILVTSKIPIKGSLTRKKIYIYGIIH